jgi:organic radical activating enzyme
MIDMASDLKWSEYDFSSIPFDRITRFGQRTLLYRDIFCVSWLLGRYCNYNCSYCWPYARSDTRDHRPFELNRMAMDEIKRQSRERGFNSFHFSFSGGEPTVHPDYLRLLEHYSHDTANCNYQSVHMTSNISQGLRWFAKYVNATKDLHRVSVTASWHREQGIKQGDLKGHTEKFADKLVFLQENDIQVTVNTVMVPEWFDVLYDEAEYFLGRGINVTLKPQSDPTASKVVDGYTIEQKSILHNGMPQRDFTAVKSKVERPKPKISMQRMSLENGDDDTVPQIMQVEFEDDTGKKWYMDQAERFNAFNFNRFKGWDCESGYRSIIIREPDGAIKRSYSCSDKPLGYIETGFRLFDTPMPCISENCVSSADSKIPKRKKDVT